MTYQRFNNISNQKFSQELQQYLIINNFGKVYTVK